MNVKLKRVTVEILYSATYNIVFSIKLPISTYTEGTVKATATVAP